MSAEDFRRYADTVRTLSEDRRSTYVREFFLRSFHRQSVDMHFMVLHRINGYFLLGQLHTENCRRDWRVLRGLASYPEGSVEAALMLVRDQNYEPSKRRVSKYRNPANLGRWQAEVVD